ncbi:helix-turn-helix domain-containing protein [Paenibacillus allorhizosphaerae]|uniref:HTH cro/C1-type domain-containing protein n=1 Tax=Paenibacillus allorhizosphaerae TaxID=2849866 RepID=A0ABN7TL23_9BACL|nr:helix-turn-helix transcriptional regulator [Paenibacillus allorhizosphaerae]CAG7644932.1 hypothetical protein PAECIP111802_03385 [Paenibacillus allorhizosphaerae]
MLDISKIGAYISRLRKEKDMTQLELAEKLNISHQAVSKWERGDSMPDIGTLPLLSELFQVSVDDLLHGGERKEARGLGAIVEQLANEQPGKVAELINTGQSDPEQLVAIAPLVKASTLDHIVDHMEKDTLQVKELIKLAPFLHQDTLHHLAENVIEGANDVEKLAGLAPFLGKEWIQKLVMIVHEKNLEWKTVSKLAPFSSPETFDWLVDRCIEGHLDNKKMSSLAPFLKKEHLLKLVKAVESGRLPFAFLTPFAPFLDRSVLGDIVVQKMQA